ncbi:MAG: GntR family transcriptional regulator [Proteobacteria bacterium]|nr:GntR family transcriptional regulator [Pseudomonadota bacterium]
MRPILSKKIPVHEQVYRRLREKILYGELAPGQAVTIYGLVDELNVGMTPVREAIRRLTAEGALVFQGNRRVCLPEINQREFADLVFVRRTLEPKLAIMAAEKATAATIDEMREADARIDSAISQGNARDYMMYNHQFHFILYACAQSDLLHSIVSMLWLRYGPLYRVISGKWGTAQLADCHDETIAALIANDPKAVGAAVLKDIEQGFDIVEKSLIK